METGALLQAVDSLRQATETLKIVAQQSSEAGIFWGMPIQVWAPLGAVLGALVGALIPTIANLWSVRTNAKTSIRLKELENKNTQELQLQEQANIYKLRLLDQKLKVFIELYECMDRVIHGGNNTKCIEACRNLFVSTAKTRLLVPRLKKELLDVRNSAVIIANYYRSVKKGEVEASDEKKRALCKVFTSYAKIIRAELPKELS